MSAETPPPKLPEWLLEAWPALTPLARAHIAGQVFAETFTHRPLPYTFFSMSGFLTLSLLALLPTNPLLLPIALGGGLSLALLVRTAHHILFT